MDIKIKRIYDKAEQSDGTRVLVDRLWPRGVSKEEAKLDHWMKEIAPSTELRKWYDHEVSRFSEFSKRYKKELDANPNLIKELLQQAKEKRLTLLFGAKDEKHNQAVVLKEFLEGQ